jgi:hypothetical protein
LESKRLALRLPIDGEQKSSIRKRNSDRKN